MLQKRLEEKYPNIDNNNYFRRERLWVITLLLKLFYNKHVLLTFCNEEKKMIWFGTKNVYNLVFCII